MPKITIPDIYKKKAEGRKITVLTAYDFPTAQIVDEAGSTLPWWAILSAWSCRASTARCP